VANERRGSEIQGDNRTIMRKLVVVAVLMFGFGWRWCRCIARSARSPASTL